MRILRTIHSRVGGMLCLLAINLPLGGTLHAQMKAHFIDVGQAEAILLEFQTAAVLIDAGGEDTGTSRDRDHLLGYLDEFFERRSDLNRTLYSVIISHPHLDHTRLLVPVFTNFRVLNLVDGGGKGGSGISQVDSARKIAFERGTIYNVVTDRRMRARGYTTPMLRALRAADSEVDIRFLGGSRPGCEDQNNNSVVTLVTYRSATFLFTGDAESEDEGCTPQISRLLSRHLGGLLDVDVYKVGHHGSPNGTSLNFLTAMSPQISVISAGHHSTRAPGGFHAWQFGHPRESAVRMVELATSGTRTPITAYTMDRVKEVRASRPIQKAVYCTCWDGDVVVSVDASGQQFKVQVGQQKP